MKIVYDIGPVVFACTTGRQNSKNISLFICLKVLKNNSLPYTNRMPINIDIIRRILLNELRIIPGYVFGTDRVLDMLRRQHVAVDTAHHLVGIDPLVSGDVDGQRIVAQRLHFVRRQVSVGLVA